MILLQCEKENVHTQTHYTLYNECAEKLIAHSQASSIVYLAQVCSTQYFVLRTYTYTYKQCISRSAQCIYIYLPQ